MTSLPRPRDEHGRFLKAASIETRVDPDDLAAPPTGPAHGQAWERPVAALRRYKWLVVSALVCGVALAFAAARLGSAKYEARATVWVQTPNTSSMPGIAPIRPADLLKSTPAWIELFRSYRVVDAVVRQLALYLHPAVASDRALFAQFTLGTQFQPGRYELTIDRAQKRWTLRDAAGATLEQGNAAEPVGRSAGFQWQVPADAFTGTGTRTVKFSADTPRETSMDLLDRLSTQLADNSNFLWLTYQDSDPQLAAKTLNAWLTEYVAVASDLKRRNLVEYSNILKDQLRSAEQATQGAEGAYARFRANTITLPTEAGPASASTSGATAGQADPALQNYFEQKIEYDNLRHDRDALAQMVSSGDYAGLLLIPSVAQSPNADALRDAFKSLYETQAKLRVARQTFTDEYPAVRQLQSDLATLERQTIPDLAKQQLAQLTQRANDTGHRISGVSTELQQIPARTIEEMRLQRGVTVTEGLYSNLKNRYAEAELAEAGATPDVTVLDSAVAPRAPLHDKAQFIWLIALVGAIGAGAALALLLDRVDPRIRYAQQATLELGLPIVGTVPRLGGSPRRADSPELLVQFVESFRTIRMQVLQSCGAAKPVFAIVGAAPEDGKSLVASNLALAFAEAGLRTVLVDADTRRGTLHRTFALVAPGGITEYLAGEIDAATAARATGHDNLWLVSCGRRMQKSPELLVSPRLRHLTEELRAQFDVVIFDTPALAAGFDAFSVAAAAGRLLMVLRLGATQRRLAAVKLSVLDRLPVEFIGAVLNGADLTGEFQYYSYAATPVFDDADASLALASETPDARDARGVLRPYPQLWSSRHTPRMSRGDDTRALSE